MNLRITPAPTDEEAAAVVAAITAVLEVERAAAAARLTTGTGDDTLHLWVDASRRAAQRAGLQRGPWRLSGRLARRSRA